MCLKELRDEFLYDCECRHLAKGSLRNYRASTRFLLEFLERKQITELEDVRPRHLRDLMKEKQDAGNTPRYINDLLKVWAPGSIIWWRRAIWRSEITQPKK